MKISAKFSPQVNNGPPVARQRGEINSREVVRRRYELEHSIALITAWWWFCVCVSSRQRAIHHPHPITTIVAQRSRFSERWQKFNFKVGKQSQTLIINHINTKELTREDSFCLRVLSFFLNKFRVSKGMKTAIVLHF